MNEAFLIDGHTLLGVAYGHFLIRTVDAIKRMEAERERESERKKEKERERERE